MARRKLSLGDAIRAALKKPNICRLSDALEPWNDKELTYADAKALCAVFEEQIDVRPLIDTANHLEHRTPLYQLAILFQQDSSDAATRTLHERGMPELARLFDAAMTLPTCPAHPITIICKMFALYVYAPGVERTAAAVRRFPDEYLGI